MYIHIKNVISERLLFPPTTYLHYIHAYKHIYVHTCIHAFIYRYVHTCAAQTISNQRVYVYILPSPGIDILGGCGSGSEHHRCRHSHHLRSDGALQGRNTQSLRKTTTCMMYACMYVCIVQVLTTKNAAVDESLSKAGETCANGGVYPFSADDDASTY